MDQIPNAFESRIYDALTPIQYLAGWGKIGMGGRPAPYLSATRPWGEREGRVGTRGGAMVALSLSATREDIKQTARMNV